MRSFLQFVIIGLGAGATYALVAQGAVLSYRGSGIVNFAQGALGTLAAYVAFVELRAEHNFKTLPACLSGILAAVLVSLVFQRIVLRALRHAATIVRVIATMLLVEQHVRQAMAVADRVYVLERGQVVLSGPVSEVRSQVDAIEAAYLSAAPAPGG